MQKKPKMSKKNVFTLVMILIIAACLVIFFVLKVLPKLTGSPRETVLETAAEENTADPVYTGKIVAGDSEIDTDTGKYVYYQGKKYQYNDHLTNILLMGVDKTTDNAYDEESRTAGRSDVLYLISVDRQTGDYTQIQIPRNTLTQIDYVDDNGISQGKREDYICLAYYFGDGKYESCKLTKSAVSDLFYGLPIEQYAALNLDAIQTLAELAGEVPVVVPNDSLEERYPEFKKGETVILTPENTEIFVRSRDTSRDLTSFDREERQRTYLSAYKSVAAKKAGEDPHFLTEVYEALQPYMITNMNNGEFVKMLEAAIADSDSTSLTLPGEATHGTEHDDFYVDDDALYELVLNTFYKEVKDEA